MLIKTKEEFERIYNQYFSVLFKVAYSYTLTKNDAEDIVQDSFIKFYRARKTFNDEDSLKYYLIRITINQSIDFIRHNNKNELSVNNEYIDSLPDKKESDKTQEEIYECVCLLNDNYKTVIILYYYDNYSIKEIASTLKLSETNVKTRLSRARSKLKEIIAERRKQYGKR